MEGDALACLRKLPDESVNCCVTSPPYWGLRDYGVPGQLGLERTPEEYVARLVEVFREVRRVLRADGTLWLNLGDSYATGGGKVGDCPGGGKQGARYRGDHGSDPKSKAIGPQTQPNRMPIAGLKPKDLVGIPWRVAFALQADGWYLRSDIIWHKPNPMPESVTDRPTKAHEYLFLLSRSKSYYYDAAAIAEPYARLWGSNNGGSMATGYDEKVRIGGHSRKVPYPVPKPEGRNRRSVWTIATKPFKGAHFATFPPKLIEPCILAGCPREGKRCDCDDLILTPRGSGPVNDPTLLTGRAGMDRPRRENEGTRPITRREQRWHAAQMKISPHRKQMARAAGSAFAHYIRTDYPNGARPLPDDLLHKWLERGWLTPGPPCPHPVEPAGIVLDPFAGAFTTALVCQQLGRDSINIELSREYIALGIDRLGAALSKARAAA